MSESAPEPERPTADIVLTPEDRADLLELFGTVFHGRGDARRLLQAIGFPIGSLPGWSDSVAALDWWDEIFTLLDAGLVPEGYRRLLTRAVRQYRGNTGLFDLYRRYVADVPAAAAPGVANPSCVVFIRASSEEERQAAFEQLRALDLDPQEWVTTDLVAAYTVASTDQATVSAQMGRTRLPWTVASPNGASYLVHTLIVEGPDGSRFRLRDTPAAVRLETIASEVVATQYAGKDPQVTARPTVINRVLAGGEQERANPEQNLDEAGLADGAQVRIAFEGRAGHVAPADREEALGRARRQIVGYARSRQIEVRANSDLLPTRFDLSFTQPSFGPPERPEGPPTRIDRHRVRILLVAGFPATAPKVYWLTPYFHPNVFPTYDCDLTKEPGAPRGLVCLGQVAESWYPAKDLGDLCRVIADIAAYRNYDVFGLDLPPDDDTVPKVNFYDPEAAKWAVFHQEEIRAIGGSPVVPVQREVPTVFRTHLRRIG
ncbi:effector-associated domain EAD1-containing protein [Actinoplanes sp. NPDC049668]|uniref:effector-associated domain EAD1-containing protein n=1 Tax=unclassified Actinoplanes TaxID=2626549 RepID=UPI0033A39394